MTHTLTQHRVSGLDLIPDAHCDLPSKHQSPHTGSGGITGTAQRVPGLDSLQDPMHSLADHIWDGDAERSSQP